MEKPDVTAQLQECAAQVDFADAEVQRLKRELEPLRQQLDNATKDLRQAWARRRELIAAGRKAGMSEPELVALSGAGITTVQRVTQELRRGL